MTGQIDTLRRCYPGAVTFTFGDGPELCAELIALVRAGKKVASCGSLAQYQTTEPMPQPGRRDIALHWDGTPALVIETVQIVQCRFCDVTEAMALAEGEDDSLEGWRDGHRRYFERNGGFSWEMMVLWEKFVLVENLGNTA